MPSPSPITRSLDLNEIANAVAEAIGKDIHIHIDGISIGLVAYCEVENEYYWMDLSSDFWHDSEIPTTTAGWVAALDDAWEAGEWEATY